MSRVSRRRLRLIVTAAMALAALLSSSSTTMRISATRAPSPLSLSFPTMTTATMKPRLAEGRTLVSTHSMHRHHCCVFPAFSLDGAYCRSRRRRFRERLAVVHAAVPPRAEAAAAARSGSAFTFASHVGFGVGGAIRSSSSSSSLSFPSLSSRVGPLSASPATQDAPRSPPVPMTLLAGFLGSGKTTALKNLLENTDGIRVGVIVNDVASVNIDAKLISNPGNYDDDDDENNGGGRGRGRGRGRGGDFAAEYGVDGGAVELQNGCACCSLADELLTSVETLMDGGRRSFDAVVVELSGVADPVAVKQNWAQAKLMEHPATKLVDVDRVVTVIDSCTFGTDWMTWDSAADRNGWTEDGDDCSGQRKVPELLAEQVEAADLLLVNKIDLAGPDQVVVASSVARSINDKADVFEVEFGKIEVEKILGGSIFTTKEKEKVHGGVDEGHSHDHDAASCADPDCTDSTHDHSHSHNHDASSACSDPDCTDATHDHSHSHSHDHHCGDPDCADESHSHDHSHASSASEGNTSTANLGISNFVYKAARPFNSIRLLVLLNQWPVPIKEELDLGQLRQAATDGIEMEDGSVKGVGGDGEGGEKKEEEKKKKTVVVKSPFVGVLRSKGFCWMAPTTWTGLAEDVWRHDTAMYWSHAGKHFGITTAGKWWSSITKEQMRKYFESNVKEYERILKEDWASEEWGDRRQELVFIGAGLDEDKIRDALDGCLLTDEELDEYRRNLRNFIDTTFTSEAVVGGAGGGPPSLFDTERTDHLDMEK